MGEAPGGGSGHSGARWAACCYSQPSEPEVERAADPHCCVCSSVGVPLGSQCSAGGCRRSVISGEVSGNSAASRTAVDALRNSWATAVAAAGYTAPEPDGPEHAQHLSCDRGDRHDGGRYDGERSADAVFGQPGPRRCSPRFHRTRGRRPAPTMGCPCRGVRPVPLPLSETRPARTGTTLCSPSPAGQGSRPRGTR